MLNLTPTQPEPGEPRPLDDHQAAAAAAAAPFDMNAAMAEARQVADAIESGAMPPDTELFPVQLRPRDAEYVRDRAAAFRETPTQHVASIVRLFRQTDPWRTVDTRPAQRGAPAGSGRRG